MEQLQEELTEIKQKISIKKNIELQPNYLEEESEYKGEINKIFEEDKAEQGQNGYENAIIESEDESLESKLNGAVVS